MSENNKSTTIIPSELRLSYKWDNAIENLVVKATVGTVVAGLAALVLFRAGPKRFATIAFGAGIGVGDAFRTAYLEFEKEAKE